MGSRKLLALLLALVGPWGAGHVHLGWRARGTAWLAAAAFALIGLGCAVPTLGPHIGWGAALLAPFGLSLVIWVVSLLDLLRLPAGGPTPAWHTVLFFFAGFAIPVVVSVVVRLTALEAFVVPTESMQPSVLAGDHLFAAPRDHRARYGDIIVLASPEHPEQMLVKRVMARPNDILEVKSGRPYVNGWAVPSCSLGKVSLGDASGELVVEFLGDASYVVFYDSARPTAQHAGPLYAARDGVLVLGDDRNDSADSRTWHNGQGGNVPASSLRGRALFVWLRGSPIDAHRFGMDLTRIDLPTSLEHLRPDLDRCLAARPDAWPPVSIRANQ